MIDELLQMLESGRYQECIAQGQEYLLQGGWTTGELAKINMVICRSRLGMNNILEAIPHGQQAMELAEEAGEWDILGRVLLNMGTAHIGMRHLDEALRTLYRYFDYQDLYTSSSQFEGAVWKHLGVTHQHKLECDKAIECLEKAIAWYKSRGITMSVFSCRHDLINTYLYMYDSWKIHDLTPIEQLLKLQHPIVKEFKGDTYYEATYCLDRAAYNMYRKRYTRAYASARRARKLRPDDPWTGFHSNLSQGRTCIRATRPRQALHHVLNARAFAAKMRHFDLEYVAIKVMIDLLRAQDVKLVRQLDQEYKEQGIDLAEFVSPVVLQRYVN